MQPLTGIPSGSAFRELTTENRQLKLYPESEKCLTTRTPNYP
jgi:hypothetical protein